MKTKIELSKIAQMSIKDFQAEAQREFKRLAASGEQTDIVVLTDFSFKCGNIGAVVIPGDFTGDLQKYYKEQKAARSKEKDYGVGSCTVRDGQVYIDLKEGAAKPNDLTKGLKKVKINFDTVITKNAKVEEDDASNEPSKETKETPKDTNENSTPKENTKNDALSQGMDKVKAQFQKMRDFLPRATAGTMTKEDFAVFAALHQQMQQWFGLYTAAPANEQAAYKDQAQKLKEQYTKIATLVQKNKKNS